jgi:hypothetical protein
MKRRATNRTSKASWYSVLAVLAPTIISAGIARAEQPPPPCHPNLNAEADQAEVADRGDIAKLPKPLKERLIQMADRPHTFLPMQAFNEADKPDQLFQYYLLDTTGFEPNVFTARIPGVNDQVELTVTGGNCGLPRQDGHAKFGSILPADAEVLAAMGTGQNVEGKIFTTDGRAVHFPSNSDHFPDVQTNVVPIQESMGAYNSMQQTDVHSYWEFNYTGTNWIHPLYELPFTGGLNDDFAQGKIGKLQSIVPGSGPRGVQNDPTKVGDNPNLPRDPDKFEGDVDKQREFRERGIPSGLANEVYLDVYERLASFEPGVNNFQQRLFDAYAAEVARVDANGDGIISAVEGDIDTPSDGFPDNRRLYLSPTVFNRFAVTREIDDGLLAPRFAPSQRAWVLQGSRVAVDPPVPASAGRDGDDR